MVVLQINPKIQNLENFWVFFCIFLNLVRSIHTHVNTNDIYATHLEIKWLSLLHRLNTPTEVNLIYYLHLSEVWPLSGHVEGP